MGYCLFISKYLVTAFSFPSLGSLFFRICSASSKMVSCSTTWLQTGRRLHLVFHVKNKLQYVLVIACYKYLT
uniref:Anaphase-promoting complex subunit 10 n=1 Tax=Rhizophora mucronata TaxID=61149 RepID=A0A2P2K071_RHIMU